MSQVKQGVIPGEAGVPRVSGDEPGHGHITRWEITCSPRERG